MFDCFVRNQKILLIFKNIVFVSGSGYINQYDVLSDEKKRKLYDQFGHAAFEEGAGNYGNAQGRCV